jgi:hypothetical protein
VLPPDDELLLALLPDDELEECDVEVAAGAAGALVVAAGRGLPPCESEVLEPLEPFEPLVALDAWPGPELLLPLVAVRESSGPGPAEAEGPRLASSWLVCRIRRSSPTSRWRSS